MSFKFLAQKGHFDGEGSTISFNSYHTCTNKLPTLHIAVSATVKKDNGAVVNAANATIAKSQWQRFIDRLYTNTGDRQGYKAEC